MKTNHLFYLAGYFLLVILFSCQSSGNKKTEFKSEDYNNFIIKKGKADVVMATIKLTSGELNVSKGTKNLMQACFDFSSNQLRPDVRYDENSKIGNLFITMKKADMDIDKNEKNTWNIKLNDRIVFDFNVSLGAGKGNFDLRDLNLNNFDLSTGAGEYTIDLRDSHIRRLKMSAGAGEATINLDSKWKNDFDADLTCGFGKLNLIVPKSTGVKAKVIGLAGSISYKGFIKSKNEYTNEAYGNSEYTISLNIVGAMGEVNMEVKE